MSLTISTPTLILTSVDTDTDTAKTSPAPMGTGPKFQVCVRLRQTDAPCVRLKGIRLEIDGRPPIPAQSYAFDLVLEAGEPVDRLQAAMRPILEATFSGKRSGTGTGTKIASVLMYGTSGAGKTYTLAEVLPGLVASIDHLTTVTPGPAGAGAAATATATAYISATEYTLTGQKVLVDSPLPLPGGALGQAREVGVGAEPLRTLHSAMQVVAKAKQTRQTANNATSSRSVVRWVVGVRCAASAPHGMLILLDLPGKENSQDATSKWINDMYEVLGKAMERKLYATGALSQKLAQTIQWERRTPGGGGGGGGVGGEGGLLSVGRVGTRATRAGSVTPSVLSTSSITKGARGGERQAQQAREERTMISRLCKPALRGIATFLAGLGPAPLTLFATSIATSIATDTDCSAPTGCMAICCIHPTPADRLKCRSTLDFALRFTLLPPPVVHIGLPLPLCASASASASAGAPPEHTLGSLGPLGSERGGPDAVVRLLGMLAAVTQFLLDPEEMLELCAAATARATATATATATGKAIALAAAAGVGEAAAENEEEEGEEGEAEEEEGGGVREMLRQITILAEETALPPRVQGALDRLLASLDQVDAEA